MEEANLIRTSFSLSDAEYPTFTKECEQYLENEKDDCCYQILDSNWLKQHSEQGIIVDSEGYQHYRFNFNCNGQLEVISNGFQTKT